MSQTEVYLLRHAQTIPQEGVSNKDWELSAEGEKQAQSLVGPLSDLGIEVVYSSPYIRAKKTLEPFAKASGLNIEEDPAFVEIRASENYMDPVEFQELSKKMIEDIKFTPKGGESIQACQFRFMSAVNRIAKANWGKKILICSHGLPVFGALKVFEEKFNYDDWCRMNMPDLFKLVSSVEDGGRWDRKYRLELE